MKVKEFFEVMDMLEFFVGVPDSKLKSFVNYIMNKEGISKKHIVAANEGNAVGLAAGYYLSTGNIPCVYLQNSGLGNILNPVVSLMNERVYNIPCVYVIGWRGEPDMYDEPQHLVQGEITLDLLRLLKIETIILDKFTKKEDLQLQKKEIQKKLKEGHSIAFLIKKDALDSKKYIKYSNNYTEKREDLLECILNKFKDDIVISTTGKTSRELYELREKYKMSHKYDFLTVGSMGHASSIALGVALNVENKKVICIDGDGAMLMHMGSLAISGQNAPINWIHILINNEAHESVGGIPTVLEKGIDIKNIALSCGYKKAYSIDSIKELDEKLTRLEEGPIFIEIKTAIASRKNLGRPKLSPIQNKEMFMDYIQEIKK